MNENLYRLFANRFPADRERTFLVTTDGRRLSYRGLDEASARMAGLLGRLGVVQGDRVAAQVEKSPEALILYLACLRAGAIYLPLNPAYRRSELAFFVTDAEPRLVVGPPGGGELAEAAHDKGVAHVLELGPDGLGSLAVAAAAAEPVPGTVATAADDVAAILYTSGTTGRPKGAMLTHRNLASNAITLYEAWGFGSSDVLVHALPIFHTHGLFVATHCVLLSGSSMIFLARFDAAEVIRCLSRASVFMGVPTYYVRLLADPGLDQRACAGMRLFVSGSAPLLESTFHAFRERTGHTIVERCGMTETTMNTSNPLLGERVPGTVGPPLPGIAVRVTDSVGRVLPTGQTGMLEVKGPNVFKGYWRQPEKTRAEFRDDGFFITGDLARIDDKGYVTIVGRGKDLIITGGLNVYPKEVEGRIDAIEGVAESAVIGVPHADFGEAVTAVVRRKPGRERPTADEIIDRLKGEIAGFKVPKRVVFVNELPRNAMGKVLKNILRERYGNSFAAAGRAQGRPSAPTETSSIQN